MALGAPSPTDNGLPSLSGTPAAVTYGNAAGHAGEYYRDGNGVVYRLGGCVYDPGITGGVQQYRWNKWSCVVSSVPQYSYNTYIVESGFLPAGSLTGFSWGYMAGAAANVGGPQLTVSPANPGTAYTTNGDSLVSDGLHHAAVAGFNVLSELLRRQHWSHLHA